MEGYIAFASHKHYTWVAREQASTGQVRQYRLNHAPGAIGRRCGSDQGGVSANQS